LSSQIDNSLHAEEVTLEVVMLRKVATDFAVPSKMVTSVGVAAITFANSRQLKQYEVSTISKVKSV